MTVIVHQTSDIRHRTSDDGQQTMDGGLWSVVHGPWSLPAGYWLLATGCFWFLVSEWNAPVLAQCAMCKTAAAAQGAQAAQAMDYAILILLFPAVGLFCGLFLMAFRSRNAPSAEEEETALEILRLFDETDTEGWDLHAFFEFVAGDDPAKREIVFDTVDRLVAGGYLESRGSDFYTLTEKGRKATTRGYLKFEG